MTNIVTTLWGDWPDKSKHGLGAEYVNRLARALKRNLTISYTVTALVDHFDTYPCGAKIRGVEIDADVDVQLLKYPSRMGCLPKLAAFNPEYGFEGTVFVMDLDTIICGNIDHFATCDAELITREAFREPGNSGGDCLVFQVGDTSKAIWDYVTADVDALELSTGGRERFVYRDKSLVQPEFWGGRFPGQYVSYKRHVRDNGKDGNVLPADAKIVSCHGLNTNGPRPHHLLEQGIPWVKEHWA